MTGRMFDFPFEEGIAGFTKFITFETAYVRGFVADLAEGLALSSGKDGDRFLLNRYSKYADMKKKIAPTII